MLPCEWQTFDSKLESCITNIRSYTLIFNMLDTNQKIPHITIFSWDLSKSWLKSRSYCSDCVPMVEHTVTGKRQKNQVIGWNMSFQLTRAEHWRSILPDSVWREYYGPEQRLKRLDRTYASSTAMPAPWPQCGDVACAASPNRAMRPLWKLGTSGWSKIAQTSALWISYSSL